jgi:hypothetical protein
VVVTIAVRNVPASLTQPALTTTSGIQGGREATFDAKVPLAGLAPGDYVLEISARLKNGNPVTREVPFAVR